MRAYEPMFLDLGQDTVTVLVKSGGRIYSDVQVLAEAWDRAEGPQSLESGAMLAIRTICQRIHREVNGGDKQSIGLGPK